MIIRYFGFFGDCEKLGCKELKCEDICIEDLLKYSVYDKGSNCVVRENCIERYMNSDNLVYVEIFDEFNLRLWVVDCVEKRFDRVDW